ncbi:hypothetical protein GCK32_016930 [Trichostrongylus colubriformis]|uniref:Uncharacterized protein n=1 Tax=Trichostrongylus colubriformis TaxID=6319 RepID=A0AAN8IIH5_TRICO
MKSPVVVGVLLSYDGFVEVEVDTCPQKWSNVVAQTTKVQKKESLELTPMLQNDQMGQLSFSQLAGHSHNGQHMEDAFSQICRAYVKADACLVQCEKTSESSSRVRQTYAGIRFICVDNEKEFFESLPCLSRYVSSPSPSFVDHSEVLACFDL